MGTFSAQKRRNPPKTRLRRAWPPAGSCPFLAEIRIIKARRRRGRRPKSSPTRANARSALGCIRWRPQLPIFSFFRFLLDHILVGKWGPISAQGSSAGPISAQGSSQFLSHYPLRRRGRRQKPSPTRAAPSDACDGGLSCRFSQIPDFCWTTFWSENGHPFRPRTPVRGPFRGGRFVARRRSASGDETPPPGADETRGTDPK